MHSAGTLKIVDYSLECKKEKNEFVPVIPRRGITECLWLDLQAKAHGLCLLLCLRNDAFVLEYAVPIPPREFQYFIHSGKYCFIYVEQFHLGTEKTSEISHCKKTNRRFFSFSGQYDRHLGSCYQSKSTLIIWVRVSFISYMTLTSCSLRISRCAWSVLLSNSWPSLGKLLDSHDTLLP